VWSVKKYSPHSPKTPSFGMQSAVPSRRRAPRTVAGRRVAFSRLSVINLVATGHAPAFSGELGDVDAHALARSEVRFASK
jgi:hypothetical protein